MKPVTLPPGVVLGQPDLDAMHGKVFSALAHTLELHDQAFANAYGELVDSIEMDFRHEEQLMESFQCPDAGLHREQHARILAGLHHAGSALLQGDAQLARRALQALEEWLPFHITTQDRHLTRGQR